jgi:hypothetical protein
MPGPWVLRPPLSTARGGLDSVVDVDGRIYAIGGFGTGFDPIHKSVEVRDPITEQWTFGEPMSMPRGNPGAAYADGRIYVVGGAVGKMNNTNKGESFDLSTKKWTRITNRPRGPILGPGAAAFTSPRTATRQRRAVMQLPRRGAVTSRSRPPVAGEVGPEDQTVT